MQKSCLKPESQSSREPGYKFKSSDRGSPLCTCFSVSGKTSPCGEGGGNSCEVASGVDLPSVCLRLGPATGRVLCLIVSSCL